MEVLQAAEIEKRLGREKVAVRTMEHMLTPSAQKRHTCTKLVKRRTSEHGSEIPLQQAFDDEFKQKYIARGKLPPVRQELVEQHKYRHEEHEIKQSMIVLESEVPSSLMAFCEKVIFNGIPQDGPIEEPTSKSDTAKLQKAAREPKQADAQTILQRQVVTEEVLQSAKLEHCKDLLLELQKRPRKTGDYLEWTEDRYGDDVDWDWSSEEEDDEADFTSYLTRLSGP
jgi:hypothetical protein